MKISERKVSCSSLVMLVCLTAIVFLTVSFGAKASSADSSQGSSSSGKSGASISAGRSNYAGGTYVIQVGDEIDITVVGHDELKTSAVVLQDGTISVPTAGIVHVSGLTVAQTTNLLEAKFGVFVNQPDVSVSVTPVSQPTASVLGEVKVPGQYVVNKDAHVTDLLAAAGGIAQDPKLTNATLVKAGGKGSVKVNIESLINNADQSQNLPIYPGDILFVTALDPQWLQVQVTGDVVKSGAVLAPKEGIMVASALAQAGGPGKDAALSLAQILHDGKTTMIDLRKAATDLSDPAGKIVLLPGDVLSIPQNKNMIGLMGEFQKPDAYPIPDGQSITVSQAILLGSGTTKDANFHKASFIRYDSKGKAIVTTFDLGDILQGKGEDYQLQSGDILYVPSRSQPMLNPLTAIVAAGQVFYWLK